MNRLIVLIFSPYAMTLFFALLCVCACGKQPSTVTQEATEHAVRTQPQEGTLAIDRLGNLLTIKANRIPLEEIVWEIAQVYDIQVVWMEPGDELVSVHWGQLSLHQTLHRLLRHRSYEFHYRYQDTDYQDTDEKNKLIVFAQIQNNESPPVATTHANMFLDSSIYSVALNDPDEDNRTDAVVELGTGEDSVETLIAVLLSDGSATVREQAIHALSDLRNDTSITALEHALSDVDRNVREASIDALLEFGDKRAISGLGFALHDPDPVLRLAAVEALVEIDGDVAKTLIRKALPDRDPDVREAVHSYLSKNP